ncbi:MAG: lysoplasmalogenase [Burkholderiales bacterium]|nr:lysoplasmalogenase [Burkholderiales bacterium]
MTPTLLALSVAALVSALLHIPAEYGGPRWRVYVFKPLTTTLILAIACLPAAGIEPRYQWAIVVGLLFSLAGDVFLMLPHDRFIAGLVAFLFAHIAYIAAFTVGVPLGTAPWILLPVALVAAVILRMLWPNLGRLAIPVTVYVIVIVVMTWTAAARAVALPSTATALAATGAALFLASDAILALNRFGKPFRAGRALNLATYFAGQWLIALSVALGARAA